MKKFVSMLLATLLTLTFGLTVCLAETTKDDFKTKYDKYVAFYEDTYVTTYNEFNQAIDNLIKRIDNGEVKTVDEVLKLKAFIVDIKAKKFDFFGDRTSQGKSRFDVPAKRDEMRALNKTGDYEAAVKSCDELIVLIEARVNFLRGMIKTINDYEIKTDSEDDNLKNAVALIDRVFDFSDGHINGNVRVANGPVNISPNAQLNGSLIDKNVVFPTTLFQVPDVGALTVKDDLTVKLDSKSPLIKTSGKYKNITVGELLVIDATENPIDIIVDDLKIGYGGIRVIGSNKVRILTDSLIATGTTINKQNSNQEFEIYVKNDLNINALTTNASLFVSGKAFNISNGTIINGNVNFKGSNLTLTGGSAVNGVVTAINANTTINQGSSIVGGIITKSLKISGGSFIR